MKLLTIVSSFLLSLTCVFSQQNEGKLLQTPSQKTQKSTPTPGGVATAPTVWIKANSGITTAAGNVTGLTNYSTSGITVSVPAAITNPIAYNPNGFNFNPKFTFNIGHLEMSASTKISSVFSICAKTDLTRIHSHLVTHNEVTLTESPEGVGSSTIHGGIDLTTTKPAPTLTGYAPEFIGPNTWRFNANTVSSTSAYSGLNKIVSANTTATNTYINRLWGGQMDKDAFIGSTRDWVGYGQEMIVFDVTLTATELQRVESYLALKYGITLGVNGTSQNYLSTNSTVIWDATVNAGYNTDIAGIGKDDTEALQQNKSHSESGTPGVYNDILTIANSTNFSTPTNIGTDRSYLIWGHNNQTIEILGSSDFGILDNSADIIEGRVDRVWKAQETGSIGTVTLEFDMSAIPGVTAAGDNDLANLRLLVDEDGTFASNASGYAPSSYDNATDIAYFTFDFDGSTTGIGKGFFFTLGSTNLAVTPLPATHFASNYNCNNHELNWSTATETNTDFFRINLLNTQGEIITTTEKTAVGEAQFTTYYNASVRNNFAYYSIDLFDTDGTRTNYGPFNNNCLQDELAIYPNPFNNYIRIDGAAENSTFKILNATGKVISAGTLVSNELNTAFLSAGVYFLQIDNKTQKIVKR